MADTISGRVRAMRMADETSASAQFFDLVEGLCQQAGIFNGNAGLGSQCFQQAFIGFRKGSG